jgi:PAS domain S-box-containing protein
MLKQENSRTNKRKARTITPGRIGGFVLMLGMLLSLILFILTAAFPAPAVAQSVRKQVLFINSYHVGYKFSDDITRALREAFEEDGNIELRIEYLDTKRLDSPEYLEQIRLLYQGKYNETDLDLIISSDDAALNFLFRHADNLFPDVPVVFVGANFFDISRLEGYERFTGISEEADIAGTLDIALQLQPGVTRVVVVNDTTVTGQIIRRTFDEVIPQYPQITFEFLDNVSMREVQQRVSTLTPDSLVLLTIFSRDKDGVFYEYDQFTPLITQSSAVPVFATWDFSLGYGIVGGKLTSGYTEGQRGANVAIRILNGEDPRNIPVEKQTKAQYMFDYYALEKWNIPLSRLPEESFVLDQPVSFYEQNPTLAWSIGIGFIVMLSVIIVLILLNTQRRIAQRELAVSNKELQDIQVSLEERVAVRTKALETSAEISHRLSTILDPLKLAGEVVNEVRNAFDYYYAQIYLFDQGGENLVLTAGTGEAGMLMLERGHFLPKGRGLVGRAAENNQPVLVSDTTKEPDWLPNDLLPETKSEVAIPIAVGNRVLGVLDVQNKTENAITEDDISFLETLAGQVAISLQNARLFAETREATERFELAVAGSNDGVWDWNIVTNKVYYSTRLKEMVGYSDDEFNNDFSEFEEKLHPEDHDQVMQAVQDYLQAKIPAYEPVFRFRHKDGSYRWILARGIAVRDEKGAPVRMAGSHTDITETRLQLERTTKMAKRETTLNIITQKIQNTTSMQEALQITARELGQALGRKPTLVSLEAPTKAPKQEESTA